MKHTVKVFIIIPCLVLLSGCSEEEIPTTHVSEVPAAADESSVYFSWDEPPKLIKIVKPKYPEIAREDGVEGEVVLLLILDEEGNVVKAEVATSEPANIFDEAALTAVRQYKFDPAKKDGKAIKVQMGHTIRFTLAPRK